MLWKTAVIDIFSSFLGINWVCQTGGPSQFAATAQLMLPGPLQKITLLREEDWELGFWMILAQEAASSLLAQLFHSALIRLCDQVKASKVWSMRQKFFNCEIYNGTISYYHVYYYHSLSYLLNKRFLSAAVLMCLTSLNCICISCVWHYPLLPAGLF